ncbi:aldolase/citrate lyase family protein [Mesorhizobium sp. M2E.F.Ca.ET.219.01.1.1]|uniref:HpcH/HpaI aldolase family protein n=1 Tax=Mesorhizobium sp. M2E.F.Ca.ET.219.01.1.1 TaxID=2500530 RepID=UPI000FD9CA07|nr:aldolase/citrate lyase family protein [Mesorhizobium sp. M2E.F.Ca.ET.219.01.1.1]TGQ04901.1 aldolase [Mesorhizobium sp. M2E.F.Ca.ET.219.01.1.1]TGT65390.1 aldolase [Mesorhizobium sp. M2E.F.Ca.ET.166.01.1.1]TGV97436.1 aldolase [Mesorhizobium sp. M2E.F.Ca.ET.154.01.1.1]
MSGLRQRLLAGEVLAGTFLKTPDPRQVEILGLAGLAFVVADQEHAPLGIGTLDLIALAAKAAQMPVLVRVPSRRPEGIGSVLDIGCAGIVVPHVCGSQDAEDIADAVKYDRGKRGFSPSVRGGDYGTAGPGYRTDADRRSIIMAQIEDREALEHLDDIAAVPEIDVLFVGPVDLSLSMQVEPGSIELDAAIVSVSAAARKAGKTAGLFVGDPSHIARWVDHGVSVFICGSDQSILMAGGRAIAAAAQALPIDGQQQRGS